MNSKEALRTIFINCKEKMLDKNGCIVNSENLVKIILKDLDRLEKLEKENKELRNSIKSWDETAGNLLKENRKLKKAIEILKDSLELTLYHNKTLKIYSVELMCFEEHLGMEVTQEEYELLKEVVGNER